MVVSRFAASVLLLASLAAPLAAQSLPDGALNVSRSHGNSSAPAAVVDANGRILVAWADNPGSSSVGEQQVYFTRIADGEVEPARRISAGIDDGIRAREVRLRVAPSGQLVVAWWAVVERDGRNLLTAFVARSLDGGDSFEPALATSLEFPVRSAQKVGFSNTTSLSLALGSTGEIWLLATVADYPKGFNVYFTRSSDGVTFAEPMRLSSYSNPIPRATSNALGLLGDGTLYATWTEAHSDFFDETKTIVYAHSSDGGRTFTSPKLAAGARGVVASIQTSERGTFLLSQVMRSPQSKPAIKLNRTSTDGSRFHERVKIGRTANHSHLHQTSLALSGETVAIAWTENASSPRFEDGIYVAISHDGGRTFEPARRVASGLFADPPAAVVEPSGRVGVVFTTSSTSLDDREIVYLAVEP